MLFAWNFFPHSLCRYVVKHIILCAQRMKWEKKYIERKQRHEIRFSFRFLLSYVYRSPRDFISLRNKKQLIFLHIIRDISLARVCCWDIMKNPWTFDFCQQYHFYQFHLPSSFHSSLSLLDFISKGWTTFTIFFANAFFLFKNIKNSIWKININSLP